MQGQTYRLRSLTLAFKRTEGEGEGAYSLFESTEPPGTCVELHRHPWQETFIVLDGRFDFAADGARHTLGPGEMLVIPRGAPHGFTCVSPEPGRMLTISTPARIFEAFVAETSAANDDPTIDVGAVFARHGFEPL